MGITVPELRCDNCNAVMVRFLHCDACGHARDLWLEWAKNERAAGIPHAMAHWRHARWITADEAVFRFGIPRWMVTELSGRGTGIEWRPGKTHDDAPQLDTKAFAKLKGLKAKQSTFAARQLQRQWGLGHILPSAWERLLEADESFS